MKLGLVTGLRLMGVVALCYIGAGVVTEGVLPNNSTIWAVHDNHVVLITNTAGWINGDHQERIDVEIDVDIVELVYGLAYDYRTKLLVLSDPSLKTIMMVNTSSYPLRGNYLHVGTSSGVGQITVDWLGRNVYWTDSVYGWIPLVHLPENMAAYDMLNKEFKVIVDKYLDIPTGIVVYPQKRYLFWADSGRNPKIERSDLAGNQRRIITWHGLIKPTSLCIDQSTARLYWTDQSRGTIESSELDGSDRRILVSDDQMAFYGITVFGDTVITTAPNRNYSSIYSIHSGKNVSSPITHTAPLYYVDVFSKEKQPWEANEVCDFADCQHICLHTEMESGYACLCNDGYTLHLDGKSCQAATDILQRHILYTNNSAICAVSINLLNTYNYAVDQGIDCAVVNADKDITRFAMDMLDSSVFYTDGHTIYKQLAYSNIAQTLYATAGDISDLDYNWKTKMVVWAEPVEGRIMSIVGSTIGSEPIVLVDGIDGLKSVAVDPHNGRVFWTNGSDLGVLEKDGTTGSIRTEYMSSPTDLEYDRLLDRLVWNDNGYVAMIHTDGTHGTDFPSASGTKMEAITTFKKYIIITTTGNGDGGMLFEVIQEDTMPYTISLENITAININDVHVFDITLQPSDLEACETNNGGCDHICLPQNLGTCACNLGYDLGIDGKSCHTASLTSDFYMVTDTLYNSVYQLNPATIEIHAVELDTRSRPVATTYDATRNRILYIDGLGRSVKVRDIYESSEIAIGTDVSENSRIAVDATSGNVYVTMATSIKLFTPSGQVVTLLSGPIFSGTPGQIEVIPTIGMMVWIETGTATRIMKANIDGSVVKTVVTGSDRIQSPQDIAVDYAGTDEGYHLYWCDSELDKIERVNLDTFSTQTIHSGQLTRPIAIDVSGQHVYFIVKGHRYISRINKMDGGGATVVFESALFGSLASLYVWKLAPPEHSYCGNCNGGCSGVCLPQSRVRRCACSDGSTIESDGKTCNNVNRCTELDAVDGFHEWRGCCAEVSDSICHYTCSSGFTGSAYPLHCDTSGKWNVSTEEMCMAKSSASSSGVAAGVGSGVAVLVVLCIVGAILWWRYRRAQRARDPPRQPRPPLPTLPTGQNLEMAGNQNTKDDNSSLRRSTAPPGADADYSCIDDLDGKASVRSADSISSVGSERYSQLPTSDEGDRRMVPTIQLQSSDDRYIEFTGEGDVDTSGLAVDSTGYLTATSTEREKSNVNVISESEDTVAKYVKGGLKDTSGPAVDSTGYLTATLTERDTSDVSIISESQDTVAKYVKGGLNPYVNP